MTFDHVRAADRVVLLNTVLLMVVAFLPFELALAWLAAGAALGAWIPVAGIAVIAAFNAYYWIPIRGESPDQRPVD